MPRIHDPDFGTVKVFAATAIQGKGRRRRNRQRHFVQRQQKELDVEFEPDTEADMEAELDEPVNFHDPSSRHAVIVDTARQNKSLDVEWETFQTNVDLSLARLSKRGVTLFIAPNAMQKVQYVNNNDKYDTWKIFLHRVNTTIISMNSKSQDPISITILTTDVAFFSDTTTNSHCQGVTTFWNQMNQSSIHANVHIHIYIVIAQTSTGTGPFTENKTKCLQAIEMQLATLLTDSDHGRKLTIQLSTIRNDPLGFRSLERQFIRCRFSPVGQISFELPLTDNDDDQQCAAVICLTVTYKIMPFRVNSPAANGLIMDLQLMTLSHFDVLQLVPLSCVDGAMMFGIPLAVVATVNIDNNDNSTEMKSLVSSLLQYLWNKECAMLLQSTDLMTSSVQLGDLLYHNNNQTFLLMAEEVPGKDLLLSQQMHHHPSMHSSFEAMLIRYVTAEQVLEDHVHHDEDNIPHQQQHHQQQQLAEYVERSMDCLEQNALNPLLDVVETCKLVVLPLETPKTVVVETLIITENWDDTTGVGCQPQAEGIQFDYGLDKE